MLDALLPLIAGCLPLTSVGLDGHCGTHNALPRARQSPLPLLATLRCEAARDLPYAGPSAGRGPPRTEGRKLDDGTRPEQSLQETTVEGHLQTRMSQAHLLHKEFAPPVHVVILAKTNLPPPARAPVLLFSSALALASTPLVDS